MRVAVDGARQSEILAQRAAFVFGAEQSAPLKLRHDEIDEILQRTGQQRRDQVEAVGRATLEGLSRRPVFTDVFEPGRALDHIELARAADLALVCPATANTINRLAAGLADDPVGALFLAWELKTKPWWIVPAMNAHMWQHPATAASLATLRSWGVTVLDPAEGPHACGEAGPGRLLEPEDIAARVLAALPSR